MGKKDTRLYDSLEKASVSLRYALKATKNGNYQEIHDHTKNILQSLEDLRTRQFEIFMSSNDYDSIPK